MFKLYVVKRDDIYYICKKTDDRYIDIFFEEEIEDEEVKYLASYYMVETMKKLAKDEEFYLTKKELLHKFAQLNAFNLYKKNECHSAWDIIEEQKEYLEAFKELSEIKLEIAKKIAEEKVKKLNLNKN